MRERNRGAKRMPQHDHIRHRLNRRAADLVNTQVETVRVQERDIVPRVQKRSADGQQSKRRQMFRRHPAAYCSMGRVDKQDLHNLSLCIGFSINVLFAHFCRQAIARPHRPHIPKHSATSGNIRQALPDTCPTNVRRPATNAGSAAGTDAKRHSSALTFPDSIHRLHPWKLYSSSQCSLWLST